MKKHFKKSLLLTAMMAGLAGCNVDVSQEDVDKLTSDNYDGEGVSTGEVTRKDETSITVNGIRFNISNADINLDGNNGSQDEIELGQIVSIKADYNSDGTADASMLIYDDSLQGPVDSVDVADKTLVVMGQTVLVNSGTIFDDVALDSIQAGQILEISGMANAHGQWLASYVGLSDQSLTEFDLVGTIENLDTDTKTFKLNNLLVDYSQARELDEEDQVLANGVLVDVYGTLDQSGKLLAIEVESEDAMMADDGDLLEVEGLITSALNNSQFEVAGVQVLVNEDTQYDFGDAGLLVVDALVEVEGKVNSDGSITAEYLYVEPENLVEVASVIEAIDVENNTITMMGKTFSINESTLMNDAGMTDTGMDDWQEEDFDEQSDDEFDEESGELASYDDSDFDEAEWDEEGINDYLDDEDFDEGEWDEEEWDDEGEYNQSTLKLSDLNVGDTIEIVAYSPGQGSSLVAIFLERMEADAENEVYMSAQIDSIQATQKTIIVLGQSIDLTASGLELLSFSKFNDNEEEWNDLEDFNEEGGFGEMDDELTSLTSDEFLQKVTVGSMLYLTGTNNGGSVTWQVIEVETEFDDEQALEDELDDVEVSETEAEQA